MASTVVGEDVMIWLWTVVGPAVGPADGLVAETVVGTVVG